VRERTSLMGCYTLVGGMFYMYFVYIIECDDGSLYSGITTDVGRRFNEHKNRTGAHYTSVRGAKKVVYIEKQLDRSLASKREIEIKSWNRQKKLELILIYRDHC